MAHKAPGKHHREGISLMKLFKMFPDNSAAEKWFAKARWPEGDLEKDVSVSVTPNRLAKAVVQGGAARRDN